MRGLTRKDRLAYRKGQQRINTRSKRIRTYRGRDLKEGIPVFKHTAEGIVEFIKIKGVLFKKVYQRGSE